MSRKSSFQSSRSLLDSQLFDQEQLFRDPDQFWQFYDESRNNDTYQSPPSNQNLSPSTIHSHSDQIRVQDGEASLQSTSNFSMEISGAHQPQMDVKKDSKKIVLIEKEVKSKTKKISKKHHIPQVQGSKKDREQSDENKRKYQRKHLNGKRRQKDKKNELQKLVNGYWTKNLLPFGKNHHFDFIEKKKGRNFISNDTNIGMIKKKVGITLQDYELLYSNPELSSVWQQFFCRKVLYRALMTSRVEQNYKKIYAKFMDKFQQAFRAKSFNGISRIADSN